MSCPILAGLVDSPNSTDGLDILVDESYPVIDPARRPEAAANLLKVVEEALRQAQRRGDQTLHEYSVKEAQDKVCPVYPFGGRSEAPGENGRESSFCEEALREKGAMSNGLYRKALCPGERHF